MCVSTVGTILIFTKVFGVRNNLSWRTWRTEDHIGGGRTNLMPHRTVKDFMSQNEKGITIVTIFGALGTQNLSYLTGLPK